MSHSTGTFISLAGLPFNIGAAHGGPNNVNFPHIPPVGPAGPTKFILIHFENAVFSGASRLEVNLGYPSGEIDIFDISSGTAFWTRPINVAAFAGGEVPISFITDGAGGGVQITGYGRGERHEESSAIHDSFSNSDPFLRDGSYTEPDYDPFWFCHQPPHWDNVALLPNGDIRRIVEPSVCMLVSVHGNHVSTCSATLIGNDLVITAAHCIDVASDIESMSVIFNYRTESDGSVSGTYSPVFHKVIELVNHGPLSGGGIIDYMIVRISTPPGGLGISPVPMRASRPDVGEQVFGIHHPNGAVKKISPSLADGFATVLPNSGSGQIPTQFDVSGGTSGSGLFDMMGRFVGVLSFGQGGPFAPELDDQNPECLIQYAASENILNDIASDVEPSAARDVMLVFDRSGSMSQLTETGLTKLEEAKNAAALFVELTRTEGNDQMGLVTFSSNSDAAFELDDVNTGNKDTLIGDTAPFTEGLIGGISAGGSTSIGAGLSEARTQMNLNGIGGNKRTIFLLTDGLQNTNPSVETVGPTLFNTDIFAVGYGSEAQLNGALLTTLANNHNGLYMRAETGLTLLKFFALTFGNIFEAGTLNDPEYLLQAQENEAAPISFHVCGETTITVVLGWDKPFQPVNFRIQSPTGSFVNITGQGVTTSRGRTWDFARIELPHEGSQNGEWKVFVFRTGVGGEFPPPAEDISYFVNILAKDGPSIALNNRRRVYYTGEDYNPTVVVSTKDGFKVPHANVKVTVQKPADGSGNILSEHPYENVIEEIDGDVIPAHTVALNKIAANMGGQPLFTYVEQTFELFDDGIHNDGAMEPDGVFGNKLPELFRQEGHYTFRAVATYGENCTGTRETTWSILVQVGIDGGQTEVDTEIIDTFPNGNQKVRVNLTPKDKYGNHVGPGRLNALDLSAVPGTTIVSTGVKDNGDGSYEIIVEHDPASGNAPGVVVNQPGRDPVVVVPEKDDEPSPTSTYPWWLWLLLIIILILLLLLILK